MATKAPPDWNYGFLNVLFEGQAWPSIEPVTHETGAHKSSGQSKLYYLIVALHNLISDLTPDAVYLFPMRFIIFANM